MEDRKPRIVVLGVGNILLSDEGLGVHIVKELESEYVCTGNVSFVDGGALSANLIPLIKETDILIIVDALDAKDEPGSVYKFTYADVKSRSKEAKTSLHQFTILEILDMAKAMGYEPKTIVIGVQPQDIKTLNLSVTEPVYKKFAFVKELVIKELKKLGVNCKKRKEKLPIKPF